MSGSPKPAYTAGSKCERIWEGSRKLLTRLKMHLHAKTFLDTLLTSGLELSPSAGVFKSVLWDS